MKLIDPEGPYCVWNSGRSDESCHVSCCPHSSTTSVAKRFLNPVKSIRPALQGYQELPVKAREREQQEEDLPWTQVSWVYLIAIAKHFVISLGSFRNDGV